MREIASGGKSEPAGDIHVNYGKPFSKSLYAARAAELQVPVDMRLGSGKSPKGGGGTHGQEHGEEREVVSACEGDVFAADSKRGRDQKDAEVQITERTLLKPPLKGPLQVQSNLLVRALPFVEGLLRQVQICNQRGITNTTGIYICV